MQRWAVQVLGLVVFLATGRAWSQSDLADLPGYEQYERVRKAVQETRSEGRVSGVQWSKDGQSMTFVRSGKRYVIRLSDFTISEQSADKAADKPDGRSSTQRRRPPDRDRPGRARQGTWVTSPDGKWIARYRDDNVVLEKVAGPQPNEKDADAADKSQASAAADKDSSAERETSHETIAVTTGGSALFRYGTACWVYGEELSQRSAMWWSPDSRKLAFYEIDERHMRDYYLTTDNTELYTRLHTERYPKAGTDNPYVGLLVYDLESKATTRIDVGGDRLQYVYNIRFSPDGSELLFSRTNRRQDTLEVMAADPATGTSRVVLAERQETWQENRPLMRFLEDGKRFIWETERSGWKELELRHLDGRRLNALSGEQPYPVESVVRVDEQAGWLYYTAFSGENPNNTHLHRVRLDGSRRARLTSQPLNHTHIQLSPDHRWFVARREAVDTAPCTALFDTSGKQVALLAEADTTRLRSLGLTGGELFSFRAADGKTDVYGVLHKPAHFDPQKKYPLIVSVYGGPASRGLRNTFRPADPYCEFGFLIARIANRGTTGRGKAFESATYLRLGDVDIQDQADGVRMLGKRPYVDASRVGIYGHSYGGYMSALALVKYPDVFHVGVAGAPVTDWKNYDTIYTERYMRTPQENPDGYRAGSCLTHAKKLTGKLLLMHGLVDDNVHAANTWQLADALQRENRPFDMMIYPTSKHGLGRGSSTLRWRYLHRHLDPVPDTSSKRGTKQVSK